MTQHAPLVFSGSGWLALMRDGRPVALAQGRPFMPAGEWKPIDDQTATLYRMTLEVLT